MKGRFVFFLTLAFFIELPQAKAESLPFYTIVSDKLVDSIPAGKCLIKGHVNVLSSGRAVQYAYIGSVDRIYSAISDSKGGFSFLMDERESALFFHHFLHGEIVTDSYRFKSKHVVEIDFKTNEEVERRIEVAKPVIYLYSESELDVDLTLKQHGEVTFTYPDSNEGWKVKIKGKGHLEVGNKAYPYLFWEGERENLDFIEKNGKVEGFYIQTDSTVQFLEQVLTTAGLNSIEMTDFITYWAPRMMKYKFAQVQFLWNEDYSRYIAELESNPKPDSELRLFMLFRGFDYEVKTKSLVEQRVKPFYREGFSLVEWGGAELNAY